jgi:hypothetical protein
MKKSVLVVTFVAALAVLAFVARAAAPSAPSDRPAGVAQQDWIPMSDRVGFVIVHSNAPLQGYPGDVNGTIVSPPTSGYFMLKGASRWSRVVVVEPPTLTATG